MKNTQYEKADRLLMQIGEIDEKLIYEARVWKPKKNYLARVLLIAATLVLTFAIVITSGLALTLAAVIYNLGQIEMPQNTPDPTLESVLLDCREGDGYTTYSSRDDVAKLRGGAYVVWQYADSEEFCVSRELTDSQLSDIKRELGRGEEVGESSPEMQCKVWIMMDDGYVVSPYLKVNPGNTGVEVFDYEAEIYPSDTFISYISEIVS